MSHRTNFLIHSLPLEPATIASARLNTTTTLPEATFGSVQTGANFQESAYIDVLPMILFMIIMWTITLGQLRTP